jgi:hypothetical protein
MPPAASAGTEASAAVSNYMESKVEANIAAFQADTSRLALRPDDWGLMRDLMSSSNAALERRVPRNTKKQDSCYWRKWSEFCALLDTPPIRDDVSAATGADVASHARELQLVEACFMYWVRMNPNFLVTSMLARLRGVARIHKVSLRLPFVPLSYLVQVCKGLVQERIDEQGPESLVRKQKEPLQNWMIMRWLSMSRGVVGGVTVGANLQWQGIRCLIAYFASTGARKADVALDAGVTFGLRHLSMWHATWEIRGVVVPSPSAEQLRSLDTSCYVHLTSVPCKNDPDGTKFAGTPTVCRYHPTAPINFVREFAAYEIMRGVPADQRRSTPLLLAPDGRVWRKPHLTRFFHALLLTIMSADSARSYSVHSFRIYLACALHAMGATPDRIMMMLRWSSVASLLVYCRPNVTTVSSWVHTAASAHIDAVRANTLRSGGALRPGGPAVSAASRTEPLAAATASPAPGPAPVRPAAAAAAPTPPVLARAVGAGFPMAAAHQLSAAGIAATASLPRALAIPASMAPAGGLPAAGGPTARDPAGGPVVTGPEPPASVPPLGGSLGPPAPAPVRAARVDPPTVGAALLDASGAEAAAALPHVPAAPVPAGWLQAPLPPVNRVDSRTGVDAVRDWLHSAQYQDVSGVDVSSVVAVDDDDMIASLRSGLPALERMAAASDAENADSFSTSSIFSPHVLDDGGSGESDSGGDGEW